MNDFHIVGQAPSRQGDGRPFTGPSGRRLCDLFGVQHWEALNRLADLQNLVDVPAVKFQRGDSFDREAAMIRATALVKLWAATSEFSVVLACGHSVFQALTRHQSPFFKGKALSFPQLESRVEIWNFPHPSGASAFWNDPRNVQEARDFIGKLRDRYGMLIA